MDETYPYRSAVLREHLKAAGWPKPHDLFGKVCHVYGGKLVPVSLDTLVAYMRGERDLTDDAARPRQKSETFEAIIAVLKAMAGTGAGSRSQREAYEQRDKVLREHRADLSALMSAYYALVPSEAVGSGIFEFQATLPITSSQNQDTPLICSSVAGTPALLLMRKSWVPDTLTPLNAVKLSKRSPPPSEPAPLDAALAGDVRTLLGKRCDDDPTYHAVAIEAGSSGLTLVVRDSSYQHYYNGCEALSWELAGQWDALPQGLKRQAGETQGSYAVRLNNMTRRETGSRVHISVRKHFSALSLRRNLVDPLDFGSRSVGIGVSTLTVMCRRGADPLFPLHLRGVATAKHGDARNIAEASGTVHVIPAGTFQRLSPIAIPSERADPIEMSLERNVFREFCEEILNKEKLIRSSAATWDLNRMFEDDPELASAKRLFDTGRARSFFLGCGLDLVSTKLEILTLLLVDADAFDAHRLDVKMDNEEGTLENRPMRRFNAAGLAEAMMLPNLLAAGAGCIALAHARLKEIESAIDSLLASQS